MKRSAFVCPGASVWITYAGGVSLTPLCAHSVNCVHVRPRARARVFRFGGLSPAEGGW